MARLARIVVPGCPHHVTARGNRREPIFFEDGDQDIYCDMLAEQMRKAAVEVWAYCLMPNHVHLILCPRDENGLGRALGAAHRRWANFINGQGRWRGHLFDGRFASVAMGEGHLIARSAMLRSIRFGPGLRPARRTGNGPACARIWKARMTILSPSSPCWTAWAILRGSLRIETTTARSVRSERRSRPAGRSA